MKSPKFYYQKCLFEVFIDIYFKRLGYEMDLANNKILNPIEMDARVMSVIIMARIV